MRVRSETNPGLAFSYERMTGIEPALSAWEFAEPVRFKQPEQQIRCTSTTRKRP
jgi:hypothetical protein